VRDNCQVTIGRIVIPSRTHLKRRLIASGVLDSLFLCDIGAFVTIQEAIMVYTVDQGLSRSASRFNLFGV